MYSPRPHTLSARIYPDDVPEEVKRKRLERVQKLQAEISLRKNKERIGCVEEILVEGPSKLGRGQIMGRTRTNKIVNVLGPASLAGKMVQVRISAAAANSLMGELLEESTTFQLRGVA